jgi:cyclopropane fatty-acyl-phospholipid synthase-like methyltransferase
VTTSSWDTVYQVYTESRPAAWDIGRAQPAFVRLAEEGLLGGELLDCGCGTGEQALLAASHGAQAVGIDVSSQAIERARGKAAERGLAVRFEVADALRLADLGLMFDTVLDSGVFHCMDDEDRVKYVASLASVLRDGGHCYLLCFSDRQPGDFGPRRVSQEELREAFGEGWRIASIEADTFGLNQPRVGVPFAQAWLAVIERVSQD